MPTSNGRSELPGVGEERLEAGLERRYNDMWGSRMGCATTGDGGKLGCLGGPGR